MKSDSGMGTLITVFSGIASLMCLLVGVQLLFLESQIGQAGNLSAADLDHQVVQWRAQAHMGAIMSLGAGALIFLLGLRSLATTGQARTILSPQEDDALSTVDPDSLTVRVFEVDARDQSIEITPEAEVLPGPPSRPGATESRAPEHHESGPAFQPEMDTDIESLIDPTDTIIQSIQDATEETGFSSPSGKKGFFRSPLLGRFFRHLRRR